MSYRTGSKSVIANTWSDAAREAAKEARLKGVGGSEYVKTHELTAESRKDNLSPERMALEKHRHVADAKGVVHRLDYVSKPTGLDSGGLVYAFPPKKDGNGWGKTAKKFDLKTPLHVVKEVVDPM